MSTEILMVGVGLLVIIAAMDIMVGVSNDAVNFLNSSIGSRVASRRVIMGVASLGIMAGVTFSSGMMEVARKGIFHPQFFTMPELLTIFLAVMITDIILLDLFNTYGLPTSTTVSIVFELLGAAVAVSLLKILQSGDDLSQNYWLSAGYKSTFPSSREWPQGLVDFPDPDGPTKAVVLLNSRVSENLLNISRS